MRFLILPVVFLSLLAGAADIDALSSFFTQNFNTFYQPRFCSQNIGSLLREAKSKKINLDNALVLKIVGGGFLETSGFYTRSSPNERAMLGYFHYVLLADGYIFDFDLAEPLVLEVEDYVRLQFTPPKLPYIIFGINYNPLTELPHWSVTVYEWSKFIESNSTPLKSIKFGDLVNIENVMLRKRIR